MRRHVFQKMQSQVFSGMLLAGIPPAVALFLTPQLDREVFQPGRVVLCDKRMRPLSVEYARHRLREIVRRDREAVPCGRRARRWR